MGFYYSVASGSSGNCAVWSVGGTSVLIDIGVSVRALKTALTRIGMRMEDLSALVITHEHTDHIKGLQTFVKHYDIPIYASFGTAVPLIQKIPAVQQQLHAFCGGESFHIDGLHIQSMPTPHDAAEPVAYRMDGGGHRLGYVTDVGFLPDEIRDAICGCDTVVLESNHDVELLRVGPYPYYLKQRIRGRHGHLSNEDCARAAAQLAESGTKRLILAHLSDKNNKPLTAFHATRQALAQAKQSCEVYVAPRGAMEQPLELDDLPEGGEQCSLFD